MSKWELFFIIKDNSEGAVVGTIFILFVYGASLITKYADDCPKEVKLWLSHVRKLLILMWVTLIPLSLIPNSKQLFKTRINLLKFHIAAPENISKGVDEIQRVARKLECKYIGCEDDNK